MTFQPLHPDHHQPRLTVRNTVFPNATSIATLLDKLTHHAVTLIDGESYHVHEDKKEAAGRRKEKP